MKAIFGEGGLAENYTLSKEETEEILNLMDKTSVRFAGFYTGGITYNVGKNRDEHTYHLLLMNRSSEEFTELGNFTFVDTGYVYTDKFKYKLINGDEILKLLRSKSE